MTKDPTKKPQVDLENQNYFDLFGITKNLPIDQTLLLAKYRELIKIYHPDNFFDGEDDLSLQKSQIIHQGLRILQDYSATVEYLLGREEGRIETENLLEIFALQESLSLGDPEAHKKVKEKLLSLEAEINDAINSGDYQRARSSFNLFKMLKKHETFKDF